MNKKELIQEVAIRSGMSQADVEKTLNHITDTVRDSLHKEEPVTLVGFGTFRVQKHASRQGYRINKKNEDEVFYDKDALSINLIK